MKTIGTLTHSTTSEFHGAKFLNDSSTAYYILDNILVTGWYPLITDCAWTDIAVVDGKYYAAFGEDSVMTNDSELIYIEIKPTKLMIKEYEYFKQY